MDALSKVALTTFGVVSVFAFIIAPPAAAAPTVSFDHFGENTDTTYTRAMEPGEWFEVRIKNTCPDLFTYEYFGLKPEAEPEESELDQFSANMRILLAQVELDCIIPVEGDASVKEIVIPHRARFAGYLVEIKSKRGNNEPIRAIKLTKAEIEAWRNATSLQELETLKKQKGADAVKVLTDVTLIINVARKGWDYEFAGAFIGSELTNPEFSLVTREINGEEKQLVIRERNREDEVNLGLAGFIHLSHARVPWAAGTFGLGVSDSNDVSFFMGPSLRLGGKGYLTAGYAWGAVDTLPSGVKLSADPRDPGVTDDMIHPVADSNVLNNLGSATEGAFFVGVSYSFLNPGQQFFGGKFATDEDTPKKGVENEEAAEN